MLEGATAGEKGLYITLSETEQELREAAASHGWSIPNTIDIFELVPPESLLDEKQQQSLLYSSDLELGETTKRIFEAMERVKPARVVLDSLSEIRLLAQSSLRYRRQILALKHYFAQRDVTVLLLDDMTACRDVSLQYVLLSRRPEHRGRILLAAILAKRTQIQIKTLVVHHRLRRAYSRQRGRRLDRVSAAPYWISAAELLREGLKESKNFLD